MACLNIPGVVPFNNSALNLLVKNLTITCPNDTIDIEFYGRRIVGLREEVVFEYFSGTMSLFYQTAGPWTAYAIDRILSRLIDYKVPLFMLIAQLPRPHLDIGWEAQLLAFIHVVADPIDSLSGYLFTIATAATVLRKTEISMGMRPRPEDREASIGLGVLTRLSRVIRRIRGRETNRLRKRCKLVALMYMVYESNGDHKELEDLTELEESLEEANQRVFHTAALALAADRASNFVPVWVAVFGFMATIALKYVYVNKGQFDVKDPQHITLWSLSSSMIMACAIPNVVLASVIGVQSTQHVFRGVTENLAPLLPERPAGAEDVSYAQLKHGGVSNWRPDRWWHRHETGSDAYPAWILDIAANFVVISGSSGAIWLASVVPPEGVNCRTIVKFVMMGIYILKYSVQCVLNWAARRCKWTAKTHMRYTICADAVFLFSFASVIITTQVGVLNRPGCYRMCSGSNCGIFDASQTWETVQARIPNLYAGILFGFLSAQISFCALAILWFWNGYRVFFQDDTPLQYPSTTPVIVIEDRNQIRDNGGEQEDLPVAAAGVTGPRAAELGGDVAPDGVELTEVTPLNRR